MNAPHRAGFRQIIAFSMSLVCALAVNVNGASAQDCLGRISAYDDPVADYNPFSALAHRSQFGVTIENTGSAACRYALNAHDLAQSDRFSFRIASADGAPLMDSEAVAATGGGGGIVSRLLEPAETQRLDLVYSLPEGQYLSPGLHLGEIELALTDADNPGDKGSALDTVSLPLACRVDDYLGVNIAGAGLTKTVDFGELVEGNSRRVVIEARANRSFTLEIESRHGGVLVMEPPYEDWRIEYDVDLNGRALKLPFKAGPYDRGGLSGQAFSLDFRIGETDTKRAGLYTDEITVTIRPAL
jgi:hypothetical protein